VEPRPRRAPSGRVTLKYSTWLATSVWAA